MWLNFDYITIPNRHVKLEPNEEYSTGISDGSGDISVFATTAEDINDRVVFKHIFVEVGGDRTKWKRSSIREETIEMLERDYTSPKNDLTESNY